MATENLLIIMMITMMTVVVTGTISMSTALRIMI